MHPALIPYRQGLCEAQIIAFNKQGQSDWSGRDLRTSFGLDRRGFEEEFLVQGDLVEQALGLLGLGIIQTGQPCSVAFLAAVNINMSQQSIRESVLDALQQQLRLDELGVDAVKDDAVASVLPGSAELQ